MSFLLSVSTGPEVTIKFITTDEVQSASCPNCKMSTEIELDGDSYFCNWDYIGSEYSVTRVKRSLKFSAMKYFKVVNFQPLEQLSKSSLMKSLKIDY